MTSYLDSAFQLADQFRASAAAKAADTSGSLLAGSTGYGIDSGYSQLSRHREQLTHYKSWSYVGVRAVSTKIAGQPIRVGRIATQPTRRKVLLPDYLKAAGDNIEPLKTHVLLDALADPNPIMVRWGLMYSTAACLLLTGRAHWWIADDDGKLTVWPLPPHWLRPSDKLRGSWFLRVDGAADEVELSNDDIATFMLPDPASPFGCVSPIQSQAAAVSTDEAIQRTQFDIFKSGVHPQLAIRVGKVDGMEGRPVLEPSQRIELIERILQLYGGSAKRNQPLILDGLIEGIDKLSQSPQELDFLDSGELVKSRILQALGVNPIVTGQVQDANRASSVVAAQLFAEHTVNPLCELMSQVLTEWVARRYSDSLVCWIEPARANDPELRLSEWKAAASLGYVTPNEFRQNVLGVGPIEGGDTRVDALGNPLGQSEERTPALWERSRNGSHAAN